VFGGQAKTVEDCSGRISNSSSVMGTVWAGGGAGALAVLCTGPQKILCCETP
jgi:hypothetical protein